MDWIAQINEQLERGFSKSDIEKLIGLPENNLSGALKGKRFYSKKNMLKIERWLAGSKPDPLSLSFAPKEKVSIQDLNKPTNTVEPKKPLGSDKSNIVIDTTPKEEKKGLSFYEQMRNKKLGLK